jgi:Protein of unknown function (DUF4232)
MHLPAFAARQLVGAAALACATALAPVAALAATTSPAAPTRAAAAGSTPRCATYGLVVWLDTQGNGAAGSTYYNLKLTNLSGHACTLFGYPGVSAVNLGGHQFGSAASRDNSHRPRLVSLASGATATVVLRIVDADNFPASTCRQVTAAGLRVYPPNQTAAKMIPFPFRACSRTGPVYLSVQSVQKA